MESDKEIFIKVASILAAGSLVITWWIKKGAHDIGHYIWQHLLAEIGG